MRRGPASDWRAWRRWLRPAAGKRRGRCARRDAGGPLDPFPKDSAPTLHHTEIRAIGISSDELRPQHHCSISTDLNVQPKILAESGGVVVPQRGGISEGLQYWVAGQYPHVQPLLSVSVVRPLRCVRQISDQQLARLRLRKDQSH